MIRVAVTGAAGRMGREVIAAVAAADDMTVVAAIDPASECASVPDGAGGFVQITQALDAALASGVDVLVDFTLPHVVVENVRLALSMGVDCVVGTTGVDASAWEELAGDATNGASLFVAPNFAIGAVLMMRFARSAARFMPGCEIIELHHDKKADAPSGTAARTARLVAEARSHAPVDAGSPEHILDGARGANVEGVPVHSVRLPGLVAHQEVLFGGQGQTLSIRHDSIDRTSFMPGVLLAIRASAGLSGLVVGLEEILDLA